jgi:PAS domain S-box-containing protein
MNFDRNKPSAAWPLVFLFIAISAGVILAVILHYHHRKEAFDDHLILPVVTSVLLVTLGLFLGYILWSRKIIFYRSEPQRKALIKAEDTLLESEEKFRKLFDESPFSMIITNKDLHITRPNIAFCRMIGYDEEELKKFTFRDFTHPENISVDESNLSKLAAGEIPVYQTEKRYIRKNGSVMWASTTISTLLNNRGEIQSFLGMVEDITSRKNVEAELEKSLSLLRATLESTADGLLVVDLNGKIVLYNRKFAEMWKIPDKILDTGEDQELLLFVKDQLKKPESFLISVKDLYNEPEEVTSDLLEFADGRYFERYSQPQIISGRSVGRVWCFRDITLRKRVELEMIKAREKAEESDRLKTAFLHNVSHEIRTPMNAIIGFSTLLNEEALSDQERYQYAGIIWQSSSQLLSIINDIVDIANIESGQVRVNMGEMNLNSLLRSLSEQFSYKKDKIGIRLYTGLPDEKVFIKTDGTKVIQVLSNLIGNAQKFTNAGEINFGYILKGDDLEFFVRDTGIGISPEHLSKIFNRFYQVDTNGTRQFGGTGLGLSICEAYVALLGGTIWVESEEGKGSQFFFTIPYRI